jgi:hypothetical protein
MKKSLLVLFTLNMLVLAGLLVLYRKSSKQEISQQQVEPPKVATFESALNSIQLQELKSNLYFLASNELEGRMSGKRGNILAAEFIKNKFEDFGLKTFCHKFSIRRLNPGPQNEAGDDFTQNIYAILEGSDPLLKDEIVVVGAHMDHIGYGPSMSRSPSKRMIHPGADDNASGTVALIEVAKAFSLMKGQNKRTVVFQAYSAEEMGLIGSRFYCDNPIYPESKPDIKKHVFMLNMDMIGYLGKGYYFAGFSQGDSSFDINRIIDDLNQNYNFAKKVTSRGSGGSDHASFYNKKIPIAFIHTGGHPNYHTPNDTPDKINYEGLEQIAKYSFELAWRVTNTDSAPKFNIDGFKVMSYDHDHGNPEVPFHHHYHEGKKQ